MNLVEKSTKRKNHNKDFIVRISPLIEYFKQNGTISNIHNNDSIIIDGKRYNIGRTIGYFRLKHNKGKLKQEYIDELDAMGMKWSSKEQTENLVEI